MEEFKKELLALLEKRKITLSLHCTDLVGYLVATGPDGKDIELAFQDESMWDITNINDILKGKV